MSQFDDDFEKDYYDYDEQETYIIPCKKIRGTDKAILYEFNIKHTSKKSWLHTRHFWIPQSVIEFEHVDANEDANEIEVQTWFIDKLEVEHNVKIIKE